jgi:protein-S-isoprenylcysteine O-methyltransferase Ste14
MGLLTADTPRDTAVAWGFVAGQFLLLVTILSLPDRQDWPNPGWAATGSRGLSLAGLAVLVVGLVGLGRSLTALPTPVPHGRLTTGGLYRLVRHPIYTGILALAVGSTVPSGSIPKAVATVALAGWFSAKARWEEHHLRGRYPDYTAYAARTPRFVPLWPFGADRH